MLQFGFSFCLKFKIQKNRRFYIINVVAIIVFNNDFSIIQTEYACFLV